ncbi:hydroxyethylthiazole kinase [Fructobacillus parabroussonetiae]|uniref:hydroxyethylthiazole kinase n=1 Tax=Fructobacillus parabroussonetiae TaxID=2713174 RepID=A0ABS5QVN2_9LACO|nr:hydroxyethylthiazole kinase [Fructobacillus parabroussonetiae]MBS9337263.1 hypothetical protein [Fructobacillus parabroussonetiae]
MQVIRGNLSEIAALLTGEQSHLGIDSTSEADSVKTALKFAAQSKAWVVISGKVDTIRDGQQVFQITNGHPFLAKNVGMGDALDGILALGLAHCTMIEELVKVAAILPVAADLVMEEDKVQGPASFKMALMDKLTNLSDQELLDFAHIRKVELARS